MARIGIMRLSGPILIALGLTSQAVADPREPVTDRAQFLRLVEGRTLTHIGVRLTVAPDGRITGRAFGRPVTGEWIWQARYFCRSMTWGTEPIPYNCQTVDRIGGRLRFRSDRGTGDHADLGLD